MQKTYPIIDTRIKTIQHKISLLTNLRKIVNIPKNYDLTEQQWYLLQKQFKKISFNALRKLNKIKQDQISNKSSFQKTNQEIGQLNFELVKSYKYFDFFSDILTQRTSNLGRILAGCDAIGFDGLDKPHPSLKNIAHPVTFFDPSFGSSTIRKGKLRGPANVTNPIIIIQVPFHRLAELVTLGTGILHEIGHSVIVRTGLLEEFTQVIAKTLEQKNSPEVIQKLFPSWSSEILSDAIAFFSGGIAQTKGMADTMMLPKKMVFKISFEDNHPFGFFRVLMSISWARLLWGNNSMTNNLENQWKTIYPLDEVSPKIKEITNQCIENLSILNDLIFNKKFKSLNHRAIPNLFNLNQINPTILETGMDAFMKTQSLGRGFSTSSYLAMFSIMQLKHYLNIKDFNKIVQDWYIKIGRDRRNPRNYIQKDLSISKDIPIIRR